MKSKSGRIGATYMVFGKDMSPEDIAAAIKAEGKRQLEARNQLPKVDEERSRGPLALARADLSRK